LPDAGAAAPEPAAAEAEPPAAADDGGASHARLLPSRLRRVS
jgi:hypothetical protein